MAKFKIGDKVRHRYNNNLVGIVDNINVWYTNTIDIQLNDGTMVAYSNPDNWELYFEIDDKETKEMTSYKVGDIVIHKTYNESIIVNISKFEKGSIEIVPLTGDCRGKVKSVIIENVKHTDNKVILSIDDYNKMANTIENLKKENIKLKEDAVNIVHENKHLKKEKAEIQEKLYNDYFDNRNNNLRDEIEKLREENYELKDEIVSSKIRKDINANALYYFGYQLPEIKSVLYHKPATIIFWKDGTKTVVKAQKKEKYDNEKGFVMAYLKKILGNEGNYYEVIKRWTEV